MPWLDLKYRLTMDNKLNFYFYKVCRWGVNSLQNIVFENCVQK